MADQRTQITELGTAAGMMLGCEHDQLELLDALELPGVAESAWRPPLEAAAEPWHQHHSILRAALANGAAFRDVVLRGRDPRRIDWRGGAKTMWVSDAPVDLRVDDVYLVSAKYDSVCLLNRAPAAVFDALLDTRATRRNPHWYGEVARTEYAEFYSALLDELVLEAAADRAEFPASPSGLTRDNKVHLKYLLKPWTRTLPSGAAAAYHELCHAVSFATAARWESSLRGATEAAKLGMLAQMIRVSGSVYWLLGQAGDVPVRCKVLDNVEFRHAFRLRRFDVSVPEQLGQPRVDWSATLDPRRSGDEGRIVSGFCEIRWSHGKFQGNPECKVQLRTPVSSLPGYEPLEPSGALF